MLLADQERPLFPERTEGLPGLTLSEVRAISADGGQHEEAPIVTTWINGTKIMEFTDKEKRLPDRGGIALQVHGGGDHTKQFGRYRKIRVKNLDK